MKSVIVIVGFMLGLVVALIGAGTNNKYAAFYGALGFVISAIVLLTLGKGTQKNAEKIG